MPCYSPWDAYRALNGTISCKESLDSESITLPCQGCLGCRYKNGSNWTVRLVHELAFHERSCFLTLTYDPKHLPLDGSLNVRHFQDFIKVFRERVRRKCRKDRVPMPPISYFHVGEYGSKRERPHYHAILYGYDFKDDAYGFSTTKSGDQLWSSRLLDDIWYHGMSKVGSVTPASCAYVARYVLKKLTHGTRDSRGYSALERFDLDPQSPTAGESYYLKAEYSTMSKRPGIGKRHFEKYYREIYTDDCVVIEGRKRKPPRYYDKLLEKVDPVLYSEIKDFRLSALADSDASERSPERLAVRLAVKEAQLGRLVRGFEDG